MRGRVSAGTRSLAGVKCCPPPGSTGCCSSACSRGNAGLVPLGFSQALTVALMFLMTSREKLPLTSPGLFSAISQTRSSLIVEMFGLKEL